MKKEITVDKALIKYHQIYYAIILTVSIAFYVTLFATSDYISIENTLIFTFLVLIVFVVLARVLLSPTINIWKFWAFCRVRNVHELKKRLILLGHISEKNKFFEKIENSTENNKKYWKIRLKFAQDDIFVDDKTIPDETLFFYSKKLIRIVIIFSVIPSFVFGIILMLFAVKAKYPIGAFLGFFFLIGAVVLGYFGYKKLINREPQLIIGNKGIYTKKTGFHKWEEIEKCVIITGGWDNTLLKYTHSRGHENIKIHNLNIKNNGIKLSKLLMIYKERNKLQNRQRVSRN